MIIKSHIRGGFRSAADYLKEQGQNEKVRLVENGVPHAKNLDEAFRAMWAVADGTRAKKPLHHISINPMKDERLTDKQVLRIVERLEEKYGYAHGDHQRVIVEHIKEGRQHFHVVWNRVSLSSGKPIYPYMHKKQSKIAAREMEVELGLKKPVSKGAKFGFGGKKYGGILKSPRARAYSLSPHSVVTLRPTLGFRPLAAKASQFYEPAHRYAPIRLSASVSLFAPARSSRSMQKVNVSISGMCEEQRLDYIAACDGKITWKRYFQKWGRINQALSL